MLLKCCTQYVSNFGKLSSGHRIRKGQFSFQTQSRALLKNVQTTEQLCWVHMLVRLCSKILQARLQQYMLWEFDVQGRSRKGRGTRGQIAIIPWIIENKQGNSRKTHNSASLTTLKLLTVWITTNRGKFLKGWKYRPPYLSPEKPISGQEVTVRTGHGTTDWFKIVKGVWQGCLLALCSFYSYADYIMQNDRLHESQARSRLLRKLSTTSYMQMMPLWRKSRGTREPFDDGESGEWKSWLKIQHSENKGHGIWSHYLMANRWGKDGKSDIFYSIGSKITADSDCSHEFKRCLLIGSKAMKNLVKSRDITLLTK